MKEARYFYAPDALMSSELPTDEATHAIRVLRMQEGDEIFLIDGKGMFHQANITLVTNKKCMYKIIKSIPHPRTWSCDIHLAIAPTKMMDRMEWMAEKITEIGFDKLTFLNCDFSERTKLRVDRIEKIVVSAIKQSRKANVPEIHELQDVKTFITTQRPGRKYICHCYEEFPKKDLLASLQLHEDGIPATIMVGPEGDFSIEEVRLALANGYESVSLGESRLRTETAGLMAVTMANLSFR